MDEGVKKLMRECERFGTEEKGSTLSGGMLTQDQPPHVSNHPYRIIHIFLRFSREITLLAVGIVLERSSQITYGGVVGTSMLSSRSLGQC